MTNNPDGLSDARARATEIAQRLMVEHFGPGKSSAVPASWVIDAMIEFATPPASTSTGIVAGEDEPADPWELIGFLREKLRQSEGNAERAKTAAIDLAIKNRDLRAAAPKAASKDGATGLLREAAIKSRDLIMAILQTPANVWYVASDDPEKMVSETFSAITEALAASPTDAKGAGVDPRSAFYAESTVANDLLPTTQVVAIDSFLRAVSRINLPVAGEPL